MTKRERDRQERLMPGGIPRWIRCYDNGGVHMGGSIDRYTVVYTGNFAERDGRCMYVAMNYAPFFPQGFCQHGESAEVIDRGPRNQWPPAVGRKCHLGTRIRFQDLPEDCQKVVLWDYLRLWDLKKKEIP